MALVPSLSEETVGELFRDKDGNVWVLESYSATPTATLRCVRGVGGGSSYKPNGSVVNGAVSSLNITNMGLRRLVPEEGGS